MSSSPNMSLNIHTEGMWPWETILLFPIQGTYSHLWKKVERRRLVLSLCSTHSSSISGHWEGKFWPVSNCICLEKGWLSWGVGEHHPTAAGAQLPRVTRDIKIICRNPLRREQICATDGASCTIQGYKRNNGLIFSGLRALPCFCHNGSINLPSQMGTGYGILQSSSP